MFLVINCKFAKKKKKVHNPVHVLIWLMHKKPEQKFEVHAREAWQCWDLNT